MSEIRVDYIKADKDSISLEEGTKFSGTGSFGLPGGNTAERPEVPKEGQVRYINGDVKKGLEYYNGTEWVTVGVANGSVPEGTTPIGVFGGGYTPGNVNTIDYIAITSLSNATDFGELTRTTRIFSACSSNTRGVFGGGYNPGLVNIIDYITIATTGNATDFGDLTVAREGLAACSSSTRGVFGGGSISRSPSVSTNTIDYITISTTGNATNFGALFTGRYELAACSSSTRGVFGGGYTNTPAATLFNTIDYITIATTGNATDFGDLTQLRAFGIASCSSSTRGVFGGGSILPTMVNTIDYITIATTGNATDFGDLTVAREGLAACSSSTRGVFGGGQTPTILNVIDFITIATTGNATDFGDLTQSRRSLAALSNSHGGLLTS
jgi:hypothetical protein